MTNLRILTDNAADRATITVPGTAAGMGADKLKTDLKGEVCRVLAGAATITLDWPALETVAAVVIPASNLGPSSTIRIRAYLDAAGATMLADTGVRWAAPGTTLGQWDFAQPLNVNAFADGTAPITACYLPEHTAVRKIVIDITNPDSLFIDISRLVVGGYHAPQYGAAYGAAVGTSDMTKNSRAASGDIKSDWGPRASTLQFDLQWVDKADRELAGKQHRDDWFESADSNNDGSLSKAEYDAAHAKRNGEGHKHGRWGRGAPPAKDAAAQ